MRAPLLVISLALVTSACSDRSRPRPQPPADAAAADAASRAPAPRPRLVRLDPGCTCPQRADTGAPTGRAARHAFVARMDQIHASLRRLMEALGPRTRRAVSPSSPEAARRLWRTLRCHLDCVLVGFPDVTRPAQIWQDRLARFLDTAREALPKPGAAAKLPRPVLDSLAKQFNDVARASNRSIGFPLLERPPLPRTIALDALSFTIRARRQVRRLDARLTSLGSRWRRPHGPGDVSPCAEPLAARVALHRLRVELTRGAAAAAQTRCAPDPTCAPLRASWRAYRETLRGALAAVDKTLTALRRRDAATPTARDPSPCSLSWSLLRAALAKRAEARSRLAQAIAGTRRTLRPRPPARRRPQK